MQCEQSAYYVYKKITSLVILYDYHCLGITMNKVFILTITLTILLSCGAMALPSWQYSSISLGSGNSTVLNVFWNSTSPLSTAILSTNETGVWKNYTKPIEYTEGTVPILYYHNIDDANTSEHTTIKNFIAQMDYLYKNNYNTITFAELIEHMNSGQSLPEKSIVLTFDDGWKGNYINAFPILKNYGFVATFFIITDTALNNSYYPGYMSVSEIQAMKAAGMEIGCHSKTHPVGGLVNTTANLNLEITQSRQDLYSIIGEYPKTFAYPEGTYNSNVVNLIIQNGYIGARTIEKDGVEEGWADPRFPWLWASANQTNKYIVTSNVMDENTTLANFSSKVNYTRKNEFEDMYTVVSHVGTGNISIEDGYTMDSFSAINLPDAGDSISSVFLIPSEDDYSIKFRVLTGGWNTTNASSYNPESNVYSYYIDGVQYVPALEKGYVNDTYMDTDEGYTWGTHAINNIHMAAGSHSILVSVASNTTLNGLDYFTIGYSSKVINASSYYNSPRYPRTSEVWTNFTWKNASVAQNKVVSWMVYTNDTAGNWNVTDVFSFRPGYFKPPFWSNFTSQLVTTYNPNGHSNFSIRWNNGTYPIKNVYIENNFTGTLTSTPMNGSYPNYYFNTTVLNTGAYQYRLVANDIYGGQNSTNYITFNITKASTNVTIYLNGSNASQITVYPNKTMNVTAVCNAPNMSVELRMNWILISNSTNNTGTILESGVQNHTFTATVFGNENYLPSVTTAVWNITKGKSNVKAYINGKTSNQTVTYPALVNVSGNSTTLINPPIFNIYFNSVNKSGNPASISGVFSAGVYNVIYSTEGNDNWTSEVDNKLYLTILQNESNDIVFTINNGTTYTNQDVVITYGTPITVNCLATHPELGKCNLYRVNPDSSVKYIGNNETITLGGGYYTYSATINESQNYAGKSVDYHVIVNKAPVSLVMYLNGSTNSQETVYPNRVMNVTAVSSIPNLFVELRMNWNPIANSTNKSSAIVESGAQNNTFTALVLGNENYTSPVATRTWNITKGKSVVKAYINGKTSNQTVTYPTLVNISGNSTTMINPPVFNIYFNSSSQSGNPASMSGIFDAGVYNVIYSTGGNDNWTSEADDKLYLTVLQNQINEIMLTVNNGTSYTNQDVVITYGTPITVSCLATHPELGKCNLYRVDPSSVVTYIGNNETITLGGGYYTYSAIINESQNYAGKSADYHIIVNRAPVDLTMYLNGLTSNQETTYPDRFMNVTAVSSISSLPVELRMNWNPIANSTGKSEAIVESGAQNNTFTALVLGNENYTSPVTAKIWYIAKGTSDVEAYINGNNSNQTVTYPTLVDISGNSTTMVNPPVFNIYFNSLTKSGNPAGVSGIFDAGVYNVVYSTGGNDNWTSEVDEGLYLTVLQNQTNDIMFTINNGTSYDNQDVVITYGTPITINCSVSYPELSACDVYRVDPDLNVTYIGNYENITLGGGYYTYSAVINETQNYAGKWTDYHVIVNRAVPILNISINNNTKTDVNAVFGLPTNITVFESNEGDLDCIYTLYRDGGLLNSSYGDAGNISITNETLKPGSYTYTYSIDDICQNWTYGYVVRSIGIAEYIEYPTPVLFQFSGGSGGGGGNYVPSVPTPVVKMSNDTANITMSFIASGEEIAVRMAKQEGVDIRAMNVSVLNNVSNIMIAITKMPMVSPTLYVEGGDVYSYISIDLTNMTDQDVSEVWFRFAVSKTWLSDNSINASNVTLYRWYENSWRDLNASKVGEDSDEVFYTVNSPGFSTFAIGTKIVVKSPAQPACEEKWSCTKWSECKDGFQLRSCTDANNCGNQFKPWEFKKCDALSNEDLSPLTGLMSLDIGTKAALAIVIVSLVTATIFFKRSGKSNTKSKGILKSNNKAI
jgi:PGF-pre-PGF domain-containing protein